MPEPSDLAELLDLLEPLMDEDYCSPYPSAWELYVGYGNPHKLDGEQLHDRIKAVYERLRKREDDLL